MKLHEALKRVIESNGSALVKEAKLVNMLDDYHAFEDMPSSKYVLRTVITEGYGARLLDIGQWNEQCEQIAHKFVSDTGVQDSVAEFVFRSLAYGLGWTKEKPKEQSKAPAPTPAPAQPLDPLDLTLTAEQVMAEPESFQKQHIAAAEKSLNKVVKFELKKSRCDYHAGTVYLDVDSKYDLSKGVSFFCKVDGKEVDTKVYVTVRFEVYDTAGRLIGYMRGKITLAPNPQGYGIGSTTVIPIRKFRTISNIGGILCNWWVRKNMWARFIDCYNNYSRIIWIVIGAIVAAGVMFFLFRACYRMPPWSPLVD